MARTHEGAQRTDVAAPVVGLERPALMQGFTPEAILALQRTAGNQAVARAVSVELRQAPSPPPMPPASERASPENVDLATEIDTVAQLPDAQLEKERHSAAYKAGSVDGEHEKAVRRLDALEYVASMRRLGPRKLDWKNYEYVRHDAGKRRAYIRMSVEEGIRETGSLNTATAPTRGTGGRRDGAQARHGRRRARRRPLHARRRREDVRGRVPQPGARQRRAHDARVHRRDRQRARLLWAPARVGRRCRLSHPARQGHRGGGAQRR